MNDLLGEMTTNLLHRLMSDDTDHLDEAKDCLKAALAHTVLEDLQDEPLYDLDMLALAELARTEAMLSIAQDLRYILGTIRDEGVVTK